jgi:cell division protein FtsB
VRQRGGVIPSWVLLGVIALTLTLLCFSLTLRTRASLNLARARYESEAARVEEIRRGNAEMEAEIKRLQTDPSAIADVAHQYGLIRPNEKVVLLR